MGEATVVLPEGDWARLLRVAALGASEQDQRIKARLQATQPPLKPLAPVLSVQGNVVSWVALPGVASYELAVVRHPSTTRDTTYEAVSGTSAMVTPVPGETVNYGLRANPEGSWAKEVSVAWPAEAGPEPQRPKKVVGVNGAVGWGSKDAEELRKAFGAVRFEDGVTAEPASAVIADKFIPALCSVVVGNVSDGTPLSSVNISSWVAATVERIKALYGLGFRSFEAGNEMYLKAQEFDSKTYAAMVMALYTAIDATSLAGNIRVGVSCINDTPRGKAASGGGWLRELIADQPRLAARADLWVAHPYPAASGKLTDTGWYGNCGPVAVETQIAVAKSLGVKNNKWALTEFGVQLSGPAYADGTLARQGTMAREYLTALLGIPEVDGLYWFSVHDTGEGTYGLVTTPTPAGPLPWEPRQVFLVLEGFARAS